MCVNITKGSACALTGNGPAACRIGVNLSDVAAVGAHAPRITEGSRIRRIPPEDWETVYCRYRRKTCPAAAPCWRGRIQSFFKAGRAELTAKVLPCPGFVARLGASVCRDRLDQRTL
jgi:hypothetical protein